MSVFYQGSVRREPTTLLMRPVHANTRQLVEVLDRDTVLPDTDTTLCCIFYIYPLIILQETTVSSSDSLQSSLTTSDADSSAENFDTIGSNALLPARIRRRRATFQGYRPVLKVRNEFKI